MTHTTDTPQQNKTGLQAMIRLTDAIDRLSNLSEHKELNSLQASITLIEQCNASIDLVIAYLEEDTNSPAAPALKLISNSLSEASATIDSSVLYYETADKHIDEAIEAHREMTTALAATKEAKE